MLFRILFIIFILNCQFAYAGRYHYRFTSNCSDAYQYYMALQPEAGREKIKKELIADPYNLMATFISDYEDCLLLLFNGNKIDYDQLKSHQYERLKLMDRGDESSPWHRLCQAGIYMHWAFVHLRFNENLKAGTSFRKSFLLLKENQRLFPGFEYDDIFLGIEEAAVGSLPDNYKWIASILGMKGNIHNGTSKVKKFIHKHDEGDAFYNEAVIYYTYINYYILADKEEAWATVSSKSFGINDNLLNSFVKINIAINYRKAAIARNVLQQVSGNENYSRYPIFDYEYGYALLHGLDNAAIERFRKFLDDYRGAIFIKDAWQKMAYAYYLQGNTKMAEYCKRKILTEGTASTDSDKQALRFAQNSRWPNITLLKVQLLTDGGYYQQAEKVIESTGIRDYTTPPLQSEYYFRLARVNDELGNKTNAIAHYNKAIEIGTGRPEQFAARSALMAGLLYEKMMQKDNALKMFRLALSMEGHDFKNSIDQQAKSGINRLLEK